jgi:hypothetical protein
MPAVEENRNVMVPVQKYEGFLVNDNEKGIQEFAVKQIRVKSTNESRKKGCESLYRIKKKQHNATQCHQEHSNYKKERTETWTQ